MLILSLASNKIQYCERVARRSRQADSHETAIEVLFLGGEIEFDGLLRK